METNLDGAAAKFWSRVDMRGPNRCWTWTGATDVNGYGRTYKPGLKTILAHRAAWMFVNGDMPPLPAGQKTWVVMHKCDNPPCCNPAHLTLGTIKDNNVDMARKGRWGPREMVRGSTHGMSKLTEEQVAEIRRSDRPHGELAAEFGVTAGAIAYARRDGWAHVKVKARAAQSGKAIANRGVNNKNARLNEDDVRAIRASNEKPGALGERFGILPDYVTKIRKRQAWAHVE